MNIKSIVSAAILGSFLFVMAAAANAEVLVIGNIAAPVSGLTTDQVRAIFLKKTNKFPTGDAVVAIDLPEGNALRDEFYLKAARKKPGQVRAYWSKRIFTGKGVPNETQASEAAVKRWVAGHSSRVGYISAAELDDSVKVLLKLP